MSHIRIPWESLSDEALQGVLEEFVSREGTEYGASDVPLETKCLEVKKQLQKGEAYITWNEEDQSCSIIAANFLLK